ncbi:hypothetical protein [Shewanella litorisediminis]|uniref:Uncharacterized protein n=1 Tax=Shewanella litorisediminis TaxID=1173586 RepID=A0ABX7G5K5_9GAMM|nr:hypothetical protein [Shewanella litorisediminis]MCL2917373.1 hypothetical protein [Shewanella litorisediminis]QRH02510.1 hypothetical protein JQC75_03545 [Shewanella litorisediminis]
MNLLRCALLPLALSSVLSGCQKDGGPCVYQEFEDSFQIAKIQEEQVQFEGRIMPPLAMHWFAQPPQVGQKISIRGKRLVQGSCNPLEILSVREDY